jgi:tetratricopeptide (TPR) repeat protein
MGKFEQAKKEIEEAHQLDPLSPIISSNLGQYAYYEHRYDDALENYNKTLEMVPDFWVTHHYRGLAYTMKGMYQQAIAEFRGSIESPGEGPLKEGSVENDPEVAASLAFAYGKAGKRKEAEAILERFRTLSGQRYVSPLYFAIAYAGLNDHDQAITYLNRAFESRHPGLVLIRIDPLFDGLRTDDRFKQIVQRFEPIP